MLIKVLVIVILCWYSKEWHTGANLVNWGPQANIGMGPYTFAHIYLDQRFSIPVLARPPLCIFCMSLFVNTPDSDNQLVRSALHAWTVFRLTCSLHRLHCSLLPEQGKSAEVYFISEHSFMDLRCATSSCTDECDIIYLCKYIQF